MLHSLQVFDDVELHDRFTIDWYDFPRRALIYGLDNLAMDPRVHWNGGFSFDGFTICVSEMKNSQPGVSMTYKQI